MARADAPDAAPWVPDSREVNDLASAARECRGCELWEPATQVVFSSGARSAAYLTNAVKHFRFEQGGKRRIHQKPDVRHVTACRPWLAAELEAFGGLVADLRLAAPYA